MVSTSLHLPTGALTFVPHPAFAGVELAVLTLGADGAPTMALVRICPDAAVPEHRHPGVEDTMLVLRGRATMWVEGEGDLALEPGTFLRVAAGALHRPHTAFGDFVAFNVWMPVVGGQENQE